MKVSRKTIAFVVTILTSILVVFQQAFGLTIDPITAAAGVGAVLTYIFFESKLDLKAIAKQPGKWRDPKFWLTVLSSVLAAVETTFQIGIPVAEIVSGLTVLVGFLFKVQFAKPKPY